MKRWYLADQGDTALTECDGGGYVLFDDIAQLERDYEATRAINVRLQAEVDLLRDQRDTNLAKEVETVRRLRQTMAELVNAVEDTLRSHPDELSCCSVTRIRCQAARALLAAPVSAQESPQALIEWQPIETAPKDGTAVIVATDAGIHRCIWHEDIWSVDDQKFGPYPLRRYCKATHWMPLPAPPEAAGGKTP